MTNVTLSIGGRDYTVACAEGEEPRIAALGRLIDEKLATMPGAPQGETRALLFAALLLADELQELRGTARAASDSAVRLAETDAAEPPSDPRLAEIARRAENLAAHLEELAPNA